MTINIRPFKTEDAEACANLIDQNKDDLSDLYTADSLVKASSYTYYFVAELTRPKKVVGMIGVSDLNNGIAMLGTLCVDSKSKGKGIGTQLVRKAKNYLKEKKFHKGLFFTHEKNKPMMILGIKEDFIPEGVLRKNFRGGRNVVCLSYFL
jgi:RimJ/RimL family protein N-acetyltransferase